ncbi:hypothetical protein B0H19DRAFT_1385701 [Mycena capillaripes]|nr:hypothetical protein B0H19DRAFT_1385701 [Mycena capillaripes]
MLPQELWNYIVLFLTFGGTEDLKTCCRVSRSLCAAAQPGLFRTITLHLTRKVTWVRHRLVSVIVGLGESRRLRKVLSHSPHLIPYIHRLDIHLHAEVLTELLAIGLTDVRGIRLRTTTKTPDYTDERSLLLAQRLISLSTIERVELHSIRRPAGFFTRLLADTSPQLSEIDIDTCELSSSDHELYHEGSAEQFIQPAHCRVTHLRVVSSPNFISWLVDAACPLNLANLTHAEVASVRDPHIANLLRGSHDTLSKLSFTPNDLPSVPPLRLLPVLAHLTLVTPTARGLPALLTLLKTCDPTNDIQVITISLAGHDEELQIRECFATFDGELAGISLPTLQRVQICLPPSGSASSHKADGMAYWKTLYLPMLPGLLERGLLAYKRLLEVASLDAVVPTALLSLSKFNYGH